MQYQGHVTGFSMSIGFYITIFSERAQLEYAINFEQNSESTAKIFQFFKKQLC